MKTAALVLVLAITVSCEDVGSRGKMGTPNIQPIESETANSIRSHLHRATGTTILTAQGETTAAAALPVGYDEIPNLEQADDGITGDAVVRAKRPIGECGLSVNFKTLSQRLRDCATVNPNQAEWKGAANGTAGEGTWKLVARAGDNQEIWLDETTGFMWSYVITTTSNWCQAAGNTQGPAKEGGIDCSVLHDSVTRCEGASFLGIPASEIAWRLPTRNDYLQADLNGARFVLPKTTTAVWTATVSTVDREKAWSILPQTGELTAQPRSASMAVRCLGRRLK
jgi:hypothetical protein